MSELKWSALQQEVLNSKNSLLVSAGAGSGKTTIMIEKAYQFLKFGGDIKRIAILTFANSAAAEMKSRLMDRIKRGIYGENEATSNLLRLQLQNAVFANVTTISSFCLNLTKKYFNVAGVDPSFIICDEKEAEGLLDSAVENIISDFLEKEDEKFLEFSSLISSGRNLNNLKNIIKNLYGVLSLSPDPDKFRNKILSDLDFGSSDACKYLIKDLNGQILSLKNRGYKTAKILHERGADIYSNYIKQYYTDYLNSIKEFLSYDDLKQPLIFAPVNLPKEGGVDETVKKEMQEYRDDVKSFFNNLDFYRDFEGNINRDKQSKIFIPLLIELEKKTEEEYKKLKEDISKLDFNDLERYALEIFNKLGDEIAKDYDYIFVDEYQDINYLQEEIIKKLTEKAVSFMVGDVKQAIYKFRSAEPQIFLNRLTQYQKRKDGEVKYLKDNFRSDNRILEFVNEVFKEIMTQNMGGIDYKNTAMFNSKDEFIKCEAFPSVEVAEIIEPEADSENIKSVYSVKENIKVKVDKISLQSRYIANKIHSLVCGGFIWDDKIKSKRRIRYGDIAIFFTTREVNMDTLKQLSMLNVPIFTGAFREEKTTEEIDAVISVLKAADNFKNDIPLAGAMLSYFGKFTESEMLKIRRNGNPNVEFWESVISYPVNDEIKIKIDAFKNLIERIRFLSEFTDVFGLVEDLISSTGFDAYVMNGKDGTEKITALNSFAQSLYNDKNAIELSVFLAGLKDRKGSPCSVLSADGVNVLTVHKSKGLEFPIVFIANAFQKKNDKTSQSDVLFDRELGIGIRYFDRENKMKKDTLSYKTILLKKKKEEEEEFLRTFYVASTRAKNHMFILGVKKKRGGGSSYFKYLLDAKAENINLAPYFITVNEILETESLSKAEEINKEIAFDEKTVKKILDGLNFVYPYSSSSELPVKYSASHLKESGSENENLKHINLVSAEEGINYHKILELLDYDYHTKQDILLKIEMLKAEGILDDASVDIDVLYDCLNSDIIKKASELPHYKEKQFMLYVPACQLASVIENLPSLPDKILLQGVIDLLILDGDSAIIVDFKFSNKDEEELKEIYKCQLLAYEIAVKKLLNIKKVRKILYLAYQRKTIEI